MEGVEGIPAWFGFIASGCGRTLRLRTSSRTEFKFHISWEYSLSCCKDCVMSHAKRQKKRGASLVGVDFMALWLVRVGNSMPIEAR